MNEPGRTEQIKIRVLFFGAARDVVGDNSLDVSLNSPATVASVYENLVGRYPDLRRFGRSLLFAVNQEYATADKHLKTDDELAVFPPVSGGAENEKRTETPIFETEGSNVDFFELTTAAIDGRRDEEHVTWSMRPTN
jgi:molybdopterin converting factor subunit 1